MADDDQYAGSDQPQTAEAQKQSDQQLLAQQPAPQQPQTQSPDVSSDELKNMYHLGLKMYVDSERQLEENQKRLQPLYDKLNESLAQPLPQMPQFQQVPQPPSQEQVNQRLNQGRFSYLAIGLPLALILGSRGKNAAWAAMGAFGQGLAQLQQNNVSGAREMFQTWQESAKYAQEENQQRLDLYKLVLENRNLNLNQQSSLIENISRQMIDPYMNRMAQAKDMVGMTNEIAKAEGLGNKWTQETDKQTANHLEAESATPEGQSYKVKAKRLTGIDPYDWRDSLKRHGNMTGNYDEVQKKFPFDEFHSKYIQEQKGTSLDLESGADQQYVDANKKVGLNETPHVTDQAGYDALPSGAYWKSSDDSWHGPKP